MGYLDKCISLGHGHGRVTPIVFSTYSVSEDGTNFLATEPLVSVTLPPVDYQPGSSQLSASPNPATKGKDPVDKVKLRRRTKGSHLLPTLTTLLSSRDYWYEIDEPADYQYPGKFRVDPPRRLGFASDITSLPFYTKEDEHFLFNDVQLSKGKVRAARKIAALVDGKEEEIFYRIAPCGGVKCCAIEDCSYSISTREHRPCPEHPETSLVSSGECPVEYVYVWPVCSDDKRRWISGIVRRNDMEASNLHNHPLHGPNKVPAKVVHDIQQALTLDPTLKTHDIITGNNYYFYSITINLLFYR